MCRVLVNFGSALSQRCGSDGEFSPLKVTSQTFRIMMPRETSKKTAGRQSFQQSFQL